MIDVLIFAPSGSAAVGACIERLRAVPCTTAFEAVAIEDSACLREALARNPDRDVVWIDAGVRVPPGWLDRLVACRGREPRVATVAPFANAAQLTGYPHAGEWSPAPGDEALRDLDRIFARENAGRCVDLPIAEAHCLLVAREALQVLAIEIPEITGAWPSRIGEAAFLAGFRNLLCADLYVARDREAGPARPAAGSAELVAFEQREPLRPLRRAVDAGRLRASPRPRVLLVTHRWGGGVERHVNDEAALLSPDCEVLRLRPDGPETVELAWLRQGEEFCAWFPAQRWNDAVDLLRSLGIARVHYHHVHQLPRAALDLPAALGAPYDVTLHDYFPLCPQYHLRPAPGGECDIDRPGGCLKCGGEGAARWGLDLLGWRATFADFLGAAARVIAPSADVAARVGRHVPRARIQLMPHPERLCGIPRLVKVALLGAISELKGARMLERCVADARDRALPLHFHVVGHVDRPMQVFPAAPLTIGGSYDESSLATLIAIERPDAFLFLPQAHETYSYTLSAALQAGQPIVAMGMGAFPERLAADGRHRLVPHAASAGDINDTLLSIVASGWAVPPARTAELGSWEAYRRMLLAPLDSDARPAQAPPALPPQVAWFRPAYRERTVSMRDLYDAGVRAGQAESRAVLESRLDEVQPRLEAARAEALQSAGEASRLGAELDAARRLYDRNERELQAEVVAARTRLDELEASTFWRMTGPLRAMAHRGKRAVKFMRGPPRLSNAGQVGRDQGDGEPVRPAAAEAVHLERVSHGESAPGPRVLFVEASMLTPDQDAGSLRAWRLLQTMRSMGCAVTFVAARIEPRTPFAGQLQQEGVEVLCEPCVRSIDELIMERGGEFDVIVLARYHVAVRHIDAVRRHAPQAMLVFDTLDLHYLRNRRLAQIEGSAALAQGAEAIYWQEIDCVRRSDVTWVVSEVERELVSREVPSATVMVQSNIHRARPPGRPFAEREGLLFVGGFRHPPNVDAALHLARDIVPLLRERLPGVPTYVVGSNAPQAIHDLAGQGIEVVGYVADLEPWYARCRIAVSPLRYGAGVKGKVSEAMSHGLPVVATRPSVEGMHLVEGEEVLVADEPREFADAVAHLYHDEGLWTRLSRGGLLNVERHFSERVAADGLRALFQLAASRRRG